MASPSPDKESISALFDLPFLSLITRARQVHEQNFPKDSVELCTLLNVKTGACPEDCNYCSQSGHHNTGLQKEKLWELDKVREMAKEAKANGSKRLCMGAAWRSPPKKDFPKVLDMIKAVKEEGLEACVTLGMLDEEQAQQLKEAGLDYYNHNLDTSPEYYCKVATTRTYEDRVNTLNHVGRAGINVCCGGIMGMGETREDRVSFLHAIGQLEVTPKSIPINRLVPMKGTPMEGVKMIDNFEFVRTIAVARILFPHAKVRLSAGRESMTDEMQALCFMAGANSIFYGEKLLTAPNNAENTDQILLKKMGMESYSETAVV